MFRRIPAFLELAEQLVVGPLKMQGGQQQPSGAEGTGEAGAEKGVGPRLAGTNWSAGWPTYDRCGPGGGPLELLWPLFTEEYLQFLHEWTGVAAIVELMASLDDAHRSLLTSSTSSARSLMGRRRLCRSLRSPTRRLWPMRSSRTEATSRR